MKLTEDPIPQLVKNIAIPTSVGYFFNTMFNVVDTYFAGLLSTEALAALSMSFPIFFTMLSFSIGLSQGTTALLSNSLGEKKLDHAKRIFNQALILAIILGIIISVAGLLTAPFLFRVLGATETSQRLSLSYTNVIFLGAIFFLLQLTLNTALSAHGKTSPFRNVLILGFFLNILLNALFMFGVGSWDGFGIAGLAISTILIQFFGVLYLVNEVKKIEFLFFKNLKQNFYPNLDIQKKILSQALPATLNMLTIALGSFILTYFIAKFGQSAIAAYGAAIRIEQLILIPSVGLTTAVLTLTGQNNGAKKYQRVKESWIYAIKIGIVMMVFGGVVTYFASPLLLNIFTKDLSVIEQGRGYLYYASFTLAAYSIMFSTNSLLQGLKKPKFPLYIGIFRQFVAPFLLYPIMIKFYGLKGIWIGTTIIVWTSALITLMIGYHNTSKLLS